MVESLLERVGDLPVLLLYLVAFGLAVGESAVLVDLVVPGEVGLVLVSAAVGEGKGSPVVVGVLVVVGTIAGDSAGFWLGRRVGRRAVERFDFVRRRLEPKLDRAEEHFKKRGGVMVFVARWVGALRAVVPLVAGSARMPYRRFLLWDIPAAATWGPAIVAVGYFGGRPAASFVDRYSLYLSVAVGVGLLGWFLVRRFRHRDAVPDSQAGLPCSTG